MRQKLQYNSIYALLLKNHLVVVICLFIDAFLIRLAFLMCSDNFYGQEPMLNITTALHILSTPEFRENIFYKQLPFFLYSIAGIVKIGSEQIISARFLCLVVSSLSLVPYYYLVKKIFNSKIALLSGILLYSYHTHVILSIVSMPDVIVIGFLFLCLWMVFDEKYFLAAVFCFIACGYSYIAWFLPPVITLYILLNQQQDLSKRIKNCFLFLVITCIFPLFWNYIVNESYGYNWLWHRNFHDANSVYSFVFLAGKSMREIIGSLFLKPESGIFLLSLIGICFVPKKRNDFGYLLCISFLMFLLSLNIFRKEVVILRQGLVFVSVLLIPYMLKGLIVTLKVLNLKRKVYLLIATIIICLSSLLMAFYQKPEVPVHVKEAGLWLKENISTDSLIYIQKETAGYHSVIVMESGLPQLNFRYLPVEGRQIKSSNKQQYMVLPLSLEGTIDRKNWDLINYLKGYSIFQRKKQDEGNIYN